MYLPFFPLKLVAFPREELNLHIFEPRYKELLADIERSGSSFGICAYLDTLSDFGTEVILEKVNKRYEDGRLDVQTRGVRAFRIHSFDNPMNGKQYAGGTVSYLSDDPHVSEFLHHEFVFYLREILHLLGFRGEFDPVRVNSYTFSHKLGLKLDEELELLQMESESERTAFLIRHLKRIIPVIKSVEQAREKIRLNGHFKHLDPLNF
jgi:Lon protease-like protein